MLSRAGKSEETKDVRKINMKANGGYLGDMWWRMKIEMHHPGAWNPDRYTQVHEHRLLQLRPEERSLKRLNGRAL